MTRLTIPSACILLFVGAFALCGRAAAADATVPTSAPALAQAAPAPAPLPLVFIASAPRAKCRPQPLLSVPAATFMTDITRDPDIGTVIIVAPPVIDPLTGCGNCPGVCNSAPTCYAKKIGDSCGPNGERCTADGAGCAGANCCDCV